MSKKQILYCMFCKVADDDDNLQVCESCGDNAICEKCIDSDETWMHMCNISMCGKCDDLFEFIKLIEYIDLIKLNYLGGLKKSTKGFKEIIV